MIFATDLFRPDANVPETARNVLAWVVDLETTTAKQGTGGLCRNDRYCCLGRGCEVLGIERTEDADGTVKYGGYKGFLTVDVTAMLGLRGRRGDFLRLVIDDKEADCLTYLNDNFEWTFPQIAAFIRGSWEQQFGKSLEVSI